MGSMGESEDWEVIVIGGGFCTYLIGYNLSEAAVDDGQAAVGRSTTFANLGSRCTW